MKRLPKRTGTTEVYRTWMLPVAATLGSAVRARGILLELRARLSYAARKRLSLNGNALTLDMEDGDEDEARTLATIVEKAFATIETLPVIPREIEDILTIKTSERRRWLEDGRLQSAGTRTIRLRGRARRISFHVFDPKFVEDLLDSGKVDEWRKDDAEAAAERRRRAAYNRRLTRSLEQKGKSKSKTAVPEGPDAAAGLKDWNEFLRNGLLR